MSSRLCGATVGRPWLTTCNLTFSTFLFNLPGATLFSSHAGQEGGNRQGWYRASGIESADSSIKSWPSDVCRLTYELQRQPILQATAKQAEKKQQQQKKGFQPKKKQGGQQQQKQNGQQQPQKKKNKQQQGQKPKPQGGKPRQKRPQPIAGGFVPLQITVLTGGGAKQQNRPQNKPKQQQQVRRPGQGGGKKFTVGGGGGTKPRSIILKK